MIVDLGETWSNPTYYEIRDDAGALADAGSVTYRITELASGTVLVTSGTATRLAVGQYAVDYPTTVEGLHEIVVTATGGVLGSLTRQWRDVFTVEAARTLVGVDDAIEHLRAATITVKPAERERLRWLCQAATSAVELDLGRVLVPRAVTETLDGCRRALVLTRTPVLAVTSVTELGAALATDGSAYTLMPGGILQRGTQSAPGCWARGPIVVAYRAGYAVPPAAARAAVLDLVRQMWETGQQVRPTSEDFAVTAQPFIARTTPGYDALRAVGIA